MNPAFLPRQGTVFDLPLAPELLWAAALVVAFAGLVQGVLGIGFGLVTVPILSLLDPLMAPVPSLLLTAPMTCYMFWLERKNVDLKSVQWIFVGRFPGAAAGLLILAAFERVWLDLWIGLIVFFAVVVLRSVESFQRTRWVEFWTGVTSGITAMISSTGGPPVALLYRQETGPFVRANMSLIFFGGVFITIAARLSQGHISSSDFHLAVLLLGPLLLGLFLSHFVRPHIDHGDRYRTAILSLCATAGLVLTIRSVFRLL